MWVIPAGEKAEAGWASKPCSTQGAKAAGRLSTQHRGDRTPGVDQGP